MKLNILTLVIVLSMILSSCSLSGEKSEDVKTYKDSDSVICFNLTVEDTEAEKVIYDYYRFVEQKNEEKYITLRTEEERASNMALRATSEEKHIDTVSIKGIQFMKDIEQKEGIQAYKVDVNIIYRDVPEEFKNIYTDGDKVLYIRMKKEDNQWKIYLIGNAL